MQDKRLIWGSLIIAAGAVVFVLSLMTNHPAEITAELPEDTSSTRLTDTLSTPYVTQSAKPDRQVAQYRQATESAHKLRQERLVTLEKFLEMAADPETVVLDSRSPAAFKDAHIVGAININLADFSHQTLAKHIASKSTRILIYCNNNFFDIERFFEEKNINVGSMSIEKAVEQRKLAVRRMTSKRAGFALNIPTFNSLHAHGYTNVWELGPIVNIATENRLKFEGEAIRD